MQRVFTRLLGAGVLFVFVAALAMPVYAGELDPDPQAKIRPPVGSPATSAPESSLIDWFWMWLEAQVKISPPVG